MRVGGMKVSLSTLASFLQALLNVCPHTLNFSMNAVAKLQPPRRLSYQSPCIWALFPTNNFEKWEGGTHQKATYLPEVRRCWRRHSVEGQ